MNRFSRIRHHIDMREVKEKCLHEILVRKIKEEKDRKEKNIIEEISKKYKSNWRDELDEGMTVAGFMKTVVPSEGDEALVDHDTKNINDGSVPYPMNPVDANALTGVSDIFAPGPATVIDPNGKGDNEGLPYGTGNGGGFGGGKMWASSTEPYGSRDAGTGENSGFDMGGPYARMHYEVGGPSYGTVPYRYLTLASTDTTELSHLRITTIQGNTSGGGPMANGGRGDWDMNGAKEGSSIRVRYWVPGMSDFQYLSINPQGQTTRGQFDQDPSSDGYQLNPTDVIVPYDANAITPTNFSIELPEYARNKDVRFQLYQKKLAQSYGTYGQHWGVSNISYQRRTPISVVVSLDSPEATSFIRVGQGTKKSSPKKRKKRVEDILSAGKEYTNKYLGSDFPGSSTELSPETSPEVSSIDQEIADIQQQKRDSMSQQTKDRFDVDQSETMNNKIKVPDFTKIDSNDLDAAYRAAWQSYEAALASAEKAYGREHYLLQLKASQNNWDNYEKNRPGGPRSPRPTFDQEASDASAENKWLTTGRINYNTPAGAAIKAIFDRGEEINNAYLSHPSNSFSKYLQKDKGEDPQAEPEKDPWRKVDDYDPNEPVDEADEQWLNTWETRTKWLGILEKLNISLDFGRMAIQYARGDNTPWKKFDPVLERQTLSVVERAFKKELAAGRDPDKLSIDYSHWGLGSTGTLSLGGFHAHKTDLKGNRLPEGMYRIDDTFNVNKIFRTVGQWGIGGDWNPLQRMADRIIRIAHQRRGYDPKDLGEKPGMGIPIMITIGKPKGSKSVYKKKREALSVDEPIVTSSRSSKRKYDEYGRLKESSSYERTYSKIKELLRERNKA